jgi:hypothetical protein
MPDEPQELASVEDNTRPAFGVLAFVEGGEDLAVEIGTFGDPFVGLEVGDTFVGPGAAAEPGNIGDKTKGGLKGGQLSIQTAK